MFVIYSSAPRNFGAFWRCLLNSKSTREATRERQVNYSYLLSIAVYVLFITSLFCNIIIYLNSINYNLPTQLYFLPEILTSRVQTLLILQSVCDTVATSTGGNVTETHFTRCLLSGISSPFYPTGRREVYLRPGRLNYGSSPVPLHKDQYTTRVPKTPNK